MEGDSTSEDDGSLRWTAASSPLPPPVEGGSHHPPPWAADPPPGVGFTLTDANGVEVTP